VSFHPLHIKANGVGLVIGSLLVGVLLVGASSVQAEEASGPFEIESFTTSVSTTQAGAHPNVATSIRFASHLNPRAEDHRVPNQGPHNLIVNAPPGLIGDLTAVPTCSTTVFEGVHASFGCPDTTQVGTATILYSGTKLEKMPVVLLEHGSSQVARLGIAGAVPTVIDLKLRSTGDYGISASAEPIPEDSVFGVGLQLWGIPAQHERGCQSVTVRESEGIPTNECVAATPPTAESQWRPFLTNPTACAGPLTTTLSVDSNQEPERYLTASSEQPQSTGCGALAFNPFFTTTPDTTQADSPSGYAFGLTVPQNLEPVGFASSELRKAVVTLPPGVTLDPSAATGLQACSDAQFGIGSTTPPSCPSASVIGSDEVISPDVPNALNGRLYVGQPEPGNMYRVFQYVEGDGLDVKLEGRASPNLVTGQVITTFENLPQLPFSELKLHFKGGNTAVLANPPMCEQSTTATALTPWSGNADATPSSSFQVSSDGQGGNCPAVWPLSPSFSAGSNSLVAGANTTFSLTLSRADRTQYFGDLSAHLPPGLVGDLATVPLCPSAEAAADTCPASSQIGTVSTEAGVGETPFALTGVVYLAQPRIPNSPASLSVVVPAIAGPYDLGNVVVGADIRVNNDGSVGVGSDPLPTILEGVPLRIRQIGVDITRPGFMLNPTSCAPMSVDATVLSTQGQSADVSSPFQLADCRSLSFSPKFTVATQGSTSKANGASLTVRVAQKRGEADIHSVHVELPKQLPSRLTTLQKACAERQFASDPAGCPRGSVVGTAIAMTPTLSGPLVGPAFLVSHGAAAFPDLEIVLQGEGVSVILDGATYIKRGVTSSTFASVPDAPISGFELTLPEGPYSLLSATGHLCSSRLLMPSTIVGWNGVAVKQTTKIAVSGCRKPKRAKKASRGSTHKRYQKRTT
jgi:hypothetical protein